jgi:hypothetical protein
LRALRWCPQELLDLVNSKACRGVKLRCGGMQIIESIL